MRIDRIEIQIIRLRLREPFRISSGESWERRILLLKVDGDGARGYGECVAGESPNYSYETVETARLVLREFLIPAVIGREVATGAEMGPLLDQVAKGHEMAKAALEMAAWDLEARLAGVSLAGLLGGVKEAVPTGVSIGIQPDMETLMRRIHGFLEEGYQRIKLKIAPGRDVETVARVRAELPGVMLTVDGNAAYRSDADALRALDRFGLTLIEQPCAADDLLGMATLQRGLHTPLCLDESVTSPRSCAAALQLGAARIVNIKPGRVGGLGPSVAIHDLCAEANVPVWCGGMLESGIGRAHNVALASLPNFRLPGDTSASRRYWDRDVVTPEFTLSADGTVAVPTGPGIGVEVDEDYLTAIEVEREVFEGR